MKLLCGDNKILISHWLPEHHKSGRNETFFYFEGGQRFKILQLSLNDDLNKQGKQGKNGEISSEITILTPECRKTKIQGKICNAELQISAIF